MTQPAAAQRQRSLDRYLPMIVIGFVLVASTMGLRALDVRAETGLPLGGHDFIQHSAAFDVATAGGDPYDDETLRDAENELFPRYESGAQRFWYPPWVLVVLAPVISLPFALATAAWFVLSFAGAVLLVVLSWRLFCPDAGPPPPLVIALGLLFVPMVECLILGQMGVLVALLLVGGLLALRDGADTAAGALLALTMIRPHTVLLPLIVVGVHVVRTRRWPVIRSAVITATALVLTSAAAFPNVWAHWDPIGGSPTHFRTPTIASWIREWIDAGQGTPPTWPLFLVPALAALCVIWLAIVWSDAVRWDVMPLILGASTVVAPYAWIYDSMLLLPIHVLLVQGFTAPAGRTRVLALAVLLPQVAGLVVRSLPSASHEDLILVPLGLLLVYALALRSSTAGACEPARLDPTSSRALS